mmetsp:Transcript_28506/g.73432  ORF Transcript_28506/g.73432 Transcript_28506/m.73432 type:complete len:260 (+) Transcript_28506:274-1053(+)
MSQRLALLLWCRKTRLKGCLKAEGPGGARRGVQQGQLRVKAKHQTAHTVESARAGGLLLAGKRKRRRGTSSQRCTRWHPAPGQLRSSSRRAKSSICWLRATWLPAQEGGKHKRARAREGGQLRRGGKAEAGPPQPGQQLRSREVEPIGVEGWRDCWRLAHLCWQGVWVARKSTPPLHMQQSRRREGYRGCCCHHHSSSSREGMRLAAQARPLALPSPLYATHFRHLQLPPTPTLTACPPHPMPLPPLLSCCAGALPRLR